MSISRGASIVAIVIVVVLATLAYSFYTSTATSIATSQEAASLAANSIVPLRVFAAASFTSALQSIKSSYERNSSVSLIYNFAGSGALEQQISQGVPCDVFISADIANNARLKNASLLANGDTYQTLVYNYMGLFVPVGNPKNIHTLADLLRPGVRVVIASSSVPAGAYALRVWKNIQSKWGNSSSGDFKSEDYSNYTTKITAHVVSQTNDIESAITQVQTGAADAGFGYISDAVPHEAQLQLIPIPPDVNVRAAYTISVISATAHQVQANAFVDYMLSNQGQALLQRWGFTSVQSTSTSSANQASG